MPDRRPDPTPERVRDYIGEGGVSCPYCNAAGSQDVLSDPDDSNGGLVFEIGCNACDATWYDIHRSRLVAIGIPGGEGNGPGSYSEIEPAPELAPEVVADLVAEITAAANAHGEANSDPDYAIGDFQTFLFAALLRLSGEQAAAFWADVAVKELVTGIPEYAAIAARVYPDAPPTL